MKRLLNEIGVTVGDLILALLIIVGFWGWVNNIVKLVGMDGAIRAEFVLRFLGIFVPPLGVIMGLFV